MESSNSTFVIPSQQDISGLIAQVANLRQAEEDFIKKDFLTPDQQEALNDGMGIAWHLFHLHKVYEKKCDKAFGNIQRFFALSDSMDKGDFVLTDNDGLECYAPGRYILLKQPSDFLHIKSDPTKRFGVRCNFNEEKFRQFLDQYKDKQRQVYWDKHIEPLKAQIDRDLTPWLPFIKNYIHTDIRQAIKGQTAKTVVVSKIDDVIYELNRIQTVVEKLEKKQSDTDGLVTDNPLAVPKVHSQVYIELNVAERTLTIGTKPYHITSEPVWGFLKTLVDNKRQDKVTPKIDGAVDWKSSIDMLRRKIGKENYKLVVTSTKGLYFLSPSVKVTGFGQVAIRKTKLAQPKPS